MIDNFEEIKNKALNEAKEYKSSIPLYICVLSAFIISPFNFLAKYIPSSLLPVAVGPVTTITI